MSPAMTSLRDLNMPYHVNHFQCFLDVTWVHPTLPACEGDSQFGPNIPLQDNL